MAAYSQLAGILGAVATLRMDLALVKQSSIGASTGYTFSMDFGPLLVMVSLAAVSRPWSECSDLKWAPSLAVVPASHWGRWGRAQWLVTGWLSREERFHKLAVVRAGGGVAGEALRFASVIGELGTHRWPHCRTMVFRHLGLRALTTAGACPKSTRSSSESLEKQPRLCHFYDPSQRPCHGCQWAVHSCTSSSMDRATSSGLQVREWPTSPLLRDLVIRSVSDVFFQTFG